MEYLNIIVSIKSHDVTCDSDCLQIKWKHQMNIMCQQTQVI